ncbi:MAG: VOC family protein [Planctomycetaceae bacterium]
MGSATAITCSPLLAAANEPAAVQNASLRNTNTPPPRLQHLSLLTATPLNEMAAFYKNVLEMEVQLKDKSLGIQAGGTQIKFSPAPDQSRPYYHFAFNIPENKILSARKWLGKKTQLAVTPPQFRERNFPNEVRPLSFWNSHSLYFWDPAGNILELICRHDMKNATKGEFHREEILYASEIGLVATGTVNTLANEIMSTFQLPQYRGGGADFRAIGDETGLFVLFSQGGTPIGARNGQTWRVFPTDVSVRANIKLKARQLPHFIKTN